MCFLPLSDIVRLAAKKAAALTGFKVSLVNVLHAIAAGHDFLDFIVVFHEILELKLHILTVGGTRAAEGGEEKGVEIWGKGRDPANKKKCC